MRVSCRSTYGSARRVCGDGAQAVLTVYSWGTHGVLTGYPRGTHSARQARVVFVEMGLKRCHILLLDEPTNHLDLETIDCLTEVLVSTLHRGSNVLSWLLAVLVITHNINLIAEVSLPSASVAVAARSVALQVAALNVEVAAINIGYSKICSQIWSQV